MERSGMRDPGLRYAPSGLQPSDSTSLRNATYSRALHLAAGPLVVLFPGRLPLASSPNERNSAGQRARAARGTRDDEAWTSLQGRQRALDLGAPFFVPRRQLERGAEARLGLVEREARILGRDLEQHAAGLAEIDRAEIAAVDLIGWPQAEAAHRVRHGRLI